MSELKASAPAQHSGIRALTGWFGFGHRTESTLHDVYRSEPILPESIRFAMQYRQAAMKGHDIEMLYKSGFRRPAVYLALKAAAQEPEIQAGLLEQFAQSDFDYETVTETYIEKGIAVLKGGATVSGEKLGQLSRRGIPTEIASFDKCLGNVINERPDSSVFMIANYPYIGLDVLARHSLGRGNRLGVINPDHFGQPDLPVLLTIEGVAKRARVSITSSPEAVANSIIFDDVIRSGATREKVLTWAGENATNAIFVAPGHINAIT